MMLSRRRLNGSGSLLSSGCNVARRLFIGTVHGLAAHGQTPPTSRTAAAAAGADDFWARRNSAACRSNASWDCRCTVPKLLRSYSLVVSGGEGGKVNNGVFGVVQIGSSQFKVSPDDLIFVEKLCDHQVNDKVRLSVINASVTPHHRDVF